MRAVRVRWVIAIAASLLAADAARADFVPVYKSKTAGNGFVDYFYDFVFTPTVNGSGQPTERLISGDFVTIYDVHGLVFAHSPTNGSFEPDVQNTGFTAVGTTPADDPGIFNASFFYGGGNLSSNFTFTGAYIRSTLTSMATDNYTAETTTQIGNQNGPQIGGIGLIAVPAVPEPSAMAYLGATALMLCRRRTS